jgi:hypothetical protein
MVIFATSNEYTYPEFESISTRIVNFVSVESGEHRY